MKKKYFRLLSCILCVVMCVSLFSAFPALADGEAAEEMVGAAETEALAETATAEENTEEELPAPEETAEPTPTVDGGEEAENAQENAGSSAAPAAEGTGTELYAAEAQADGLEQLAAPSNLRWIDEIGADGRPTDVFSGAIAYTSVYPTQGMYEIKLYKTGVSNPIITIESELPVFSEESKEWFNPLILNKDLESGEYRFSVKTLGDGIQYSDSEEVFSEKCVYEKPSQQIGICSAPVLDGKEATWLLPEEYSFVDSVEIEWLFSATENGKYEITRVFIFNLTPTNREISTLEFDEMDRYSYDTVFREAIQRCGDGYYRIRVRALSNNIARYCHGEWSELSNSYNAEVGDGVHDSLADIANSAQNATLEEIRSQVQALDTDELKKAMLADNGNSGVVSVMKQLEEKAGGSQIAVTDDIKEKFPPAAVSAVGVGLNSPVDAGQPIKLIIDKAKQNDVLPTMYNSTVAVRFSMTLENADSAQLDVPVKVVLPVPDSINPQFLAVLHYHNTQDAPERIYPNVFQHDGKWYASFVLTGFSDFIMTQPADAEGGGGSEPAPHEHKWGTGNVTTQPTCTEKGVMTSTCTDCGETKTEPIDAKGHEWDAGVVTKAATKTAAGEKKYTCKNCGEILLETIPAGNSAPKTGDEAAPALYAALLIFSAAAGVFASKKLRRQGM